MVSFFPVQFPKKEHNLDAVPSSVKPSWQEKEHSLPNVLLVRHEDGETVAYLAGTRASHSMAERNHTEPS